MPFTPFHLGPTLCIGLLLFKLLDIGAFVLATIIIDIEPFSVLVFRLNYPLHGFFHSFLGGTIAGLIFSIVFYRFKNTMSKIMNVVAFSQNYSFRKIFWSCIAGIYFHIILDAFIYIDIKPFYPFTANPLYGVFSAYEIYLFCALSFIFAAIFYLVYLFRVKTKIFFKFATVFILIIIVGSFWKLIVLNWGHSSYDDGPFLGAEYRDDIVGRPDSSIRFGKKYVLECYNNIDEKAPVIVLRNTAKEVIWARVLILTDVNNAKNNKNYSINNLELLRGRRTYDGYQVRGRVLWTFGREPATFYLDKDCKFREFYLSW